MGTSALPAVSSLTGLGSSAFLLPTCSPARQHRRPPGIDRVGRVSRATPGGAFPPILHPQARLRARGVSHSEQKLAMNARRSAPINFCVRLDPQPDVPRNFRAPKSIFWPRLATLKREACPFFYPQGCPQINPQEKGWELAQSGGFLRAMEGTPKRLVFKAFARSGGRARAGSVYLPARSPEVALGMRLQDVSKRRSIWRERRRICLQNARSPPRSSALNRPPRSPGRHATPCP